ncbi:MAG: sugar ABC transporter substrate-binding protein [Gomphosphaeria aponina SAG 52.96 = DSM 107014]|uniref:Sugar ABC transporter substrate-binding protein n=1 Tax=Gomphosphaeria aponina SAG 52.96 = DSM 107014 TaxID=1521640 RepID=A0A941GWC6_9CHRO|nr:sugar ABC transporter substrate-binding protein [Gomphosphaeria aponina SAG 52.96 = DSM 107014]
MNRILKYKCYLLWAVLGLLLSQLASCQPVSSPELEFWTMQLQPQFTPYFNEVITRFEQENQGVKVRTSDVPWAAMESKILTAVAANTAPDVVNLNPNFASELAQRNAWLVIPSEVQKQYLPQIWQASTIDNLSFGVPWYLTTRVTIYNQDLLAQGGIKAPPATYTELAQFAREVKEKTGKYAFFVTFVPRDSGEVLESFVQMGVQLVDDGGKAAFNTPVGVAAFQYWVDLYQQDLLPPEVLTSGHRYAIELYQAGETALLSSGAEMLQSIENNAPSVYKVSAAAPQITGKTGKKNVAVMNLVIPRNSDRPDEALKFALFVTNTANQLAFAQVANVLPSTVDSVQQYIQELEAIAHPSPAEIAQKVSASQLKDAEVLIPAMKDIHVLQKIIYEQLQGAMLNEKTVQQAVQDAANQWNTIVDD